MLRKVGSQDASLQQGVMTTKVCTDHLQVLPETWIKLMELRQDDETHNSPENYKDSVMLMAPKGHRVSNV